MLRTYEGVLQNDHVEWRGAAPPRGRAVRVHVTVLEDTEAANRGSRMAAALNQLAQQRAFADIDDPVAWQQQIRRDRPLPGREEESA